MTDNARATFNGTLQFVTSAMFAYSFITQLVSHTGILLMNSVHVELQLFHVPIPVPAKVQAVHVEYNSFSLHWRQHTLLQTGENTQRPHHTRLKGRIMRKHFVWKTSVAYTVHWVLKVLWTLS